MEYKSASSVLDYQHDLSLLLGSDTIASSNWVVDAGITIDSETNTTTTATVWLSGGTTGQTYKLKNTVVTNGGRTYVREWYLRIQDQVSS